MDALRIDLAEGLRARLDQPGRIVHTRLGLASLPSKTPVGMASLLPRAATDLVVLAKNGKLRSEIAGRDVSAPAGRIDHLRACIPNIEAGELRDVPEDQLRQWASSRKPVVLMTRDIDESGEIAANVAPDLFDDMVADLVRTVTVLHRSAGDPARTETGRRRIGESGSESLPSRPARVARPDRTGQDGRPASPSGRTDRRSGWRPAGGR